MKKILTIILIIIFISLAYFVFKNTSLTSTKTSSFDDSLLVLGSESNYDCMNITFIKCLSSNQFFEDSHRGKVVVIDSPTERFFNQENYQNIIELSQYNQVFVVDSHVNLFDYFGHSGYDADDSGGSSHDIVKLLINNDNVTFEFTSTEKKGSYKIIEYIHEYTSSFSE